MNETPTETADQIVNQILANDPDLVCPSCGGQVHVDSTGTRTCGVRFAGHDFACGWREEPLLELAEKPNDDQHLDDGQ
jgi:hypothetical protein